MKQLSCKSVKADHNLKKVSYVLESNKVTFANGISGRLIRDLLFKNKKQTKGYIYVDPQGYKRDIGYLGNNFKKEIQSNTFEEEVNILNEKYYLNFQNVNDRALNALKFVELDESYFNKKFEKMALSELKKINLALILFYNPKIIILDYFEKNLCYHDIKYMMKLIIKLKSSYDKTIIVISDDLTYYLELINNMIIFKNGSIVYKKNNVDLYDDEIYRYLEMPKLIDFIKYVNKDGKKLLTYLDLKELIKGIYRDVENK